jgi:hypothetical protein
VQAFRPAVTTLIAEPDTQFDTPKWSPDGRTIAVERHRLGAMTEIVTVDVGTKAVRVVAAAPRTRFVMPAWRPDSAAIVVAAAPFEETFNLLEVSVDGSTTHQLTHTTGGPCGRTCRRTARRSPCWLHDRWLRPVLDARTARQHWRRRSLLRPVLWPLSMNRGSGPIAGPSKLGPYQMPPIRR